MNLFPEHPGIELRNIIKQKDMNISEFASMIDISLSRINKIVHTKKYHPRYCHETRKSTQHHNKVLNGKTC